MSPRILVCAGEPSGDLHAGPVVAALRRRWPDATIEAFGGPKMAAAGAAVRWQMEQYTVMGFAEIVGKIPAHYRLLRTLRREFAAGRFDLVILVDYPGFHLRVAEAAKAAGVRVLYYIAPQFWAWRPQRARRFRRAVDQFAVIFPFEEPFLKGLGLEARYVGHPLMDSRQSPDRPAARRALGIQPDARVLALLPGSRRQELARHWNAFQRAGAQLLAGGLADRVLVAGIPGARYPNSGSLEIITGDSESVLQAADAAIIKSGTATLEAAIANVPMVVGYRVHPVTAWFARRVMRVKWIGLANLIADEAVVPELLQQALTAEALVHLTAPLLDPANPATVAQRAALAEVRRRLGGGGAAERVAAMAAELVA